MGITIHFEGKLKQLENKEKVIGIMKNFSKLNKMPYYEFSEEKMLLRRIKGEKIWNYYSSVTGIVIKPHKDAETLRFEFDENGFIQDFCKTQFADIEVHIKIIELLRQIEQYFENFYVFDEGEYWDTGDVELLEKIFYSCLIAIEELHKFFLGFSGDSKQKLPGHFRLSREITDFGIMENEKEMKKK
jgi:hypothetical protein